MPLGIDHGEFAHRDARQLLQVAGDSALSEAVKVVTRMHKTLVWERTRHVQRLRHALREYFPAFLEASGDLDAPDALELLSKAPAPAAAARLTASQVSAALRRARRRDVTGRTARIREILRSGHLGRPAEVTSAYAASARALAAGACRSGRAGQGAGRSGEGVFWAAPGR